MVETTRRWSGTGGRGTTRADSLLRRTEDLNLAANRERHGDTRRPCWNNPRSTAAVKAPSLGVSRNGWSAMEKCGGGVCETHRNSAETAGRVMCLLQLAC